jgi:hypothetical protein
MSLATTRLGKGRNPLKEYDDEFRYADEIEANLSKMMQEIENGPRVSGTTEMKEEAYRQHEMNVAMRAESRFPNQEELKERRTGRILHMNAFAEKLRNAGVNVWYGNHEGMPGTTGMYVGHDGFLSHKCLEHCDENGRSIKPHYIGFIQVPFMQEFEELNFDAYNVPLGPKRRGWRTLGLRMIEQRIISEQKFHELFGEPPSGIVSRRYREYLQFLRSIEIK